MASTKEIIAMASAAGINAIDQQIVTKLVAFHNYGIELFLKQSGQWITNDAMINARRKREEELLTILKAAVAELRPIAVPMGENFGEPFPVQYAESWAAAAIAAIKSGEPK